MDSLEKIKENNLPRHIALIMDGNGRWAKSRGMPRIEGHRRGATAARNIVKFARKYGIKYLTFFAFSSENWLRPANEVDALMNMIRNYLKKDVKELDDINTRLHVIGEIEKLPQDIIYLINKWQNKTKNNDSMHVVMALSYGGRQDIISAVKKIIEANITADMLDEKVFSSFLATKDIPEPDLLIRTSGEQRISNFLLWQMAYTEMYFTDTYWPDFNEKDFNKALLAYANRERRYGNIKDGNKDDECKIISGLI